MQAYVEQILSVLDALIALAVVIALIGIANTLALSVTERTREIRLLPGIGMSSRGVGSGGCGSRRRTPASPSGRPNERARRNRYLRKLTQPGPSRCKTCWSSR